jgi:catechol 2,3-dioxygenase-like lactoylglutathione lyase family enzyme
MRNHAAFAGGLIGALFAVAAARAQPAAAPVMPTPPRAPSLMSATFAVTDLDRAIAFYTKGLGLKVAARIENPRATEVPLLFPAGGPSLLLIKAKSPEPATGGPPRIGRVIVDAPDLKALTQRLTGAGYALAQPLAENPQHHVLVALARDPDGNELELVQRPR